MVFHHYFNETLNNNIFITIKENTGSIDYEHVLSGLQWKITIVEYSTAPNTTTTINIIV